MRGEGWRTWSAVLYGVAGAGLTCRGNPTVQQLFACAVEQRLPELLLTPGQQCNTQDVANTFWACAAAGYTGSLQQLVSAVASRVGVMMADAKPQAWANLLWGCAKLQQAGVELGEGLPAIVAVGGAAARGLAADSRTVPQNLSNALWALSQLGWYEAAAYSQLVGALVGKGSAVGSQALSNTLLACAEACHWDRSTEQLAALISKQGGQGWVGWEEQALANSLYSWAVLSATSSAGSPSLSGMAGGLFGEVGRRVRTKGPSCFFDLHYTQLYAAHSEAQRVGLQGGGLQGGLLQQASKERAAGQKQLQASFRKHPTAAEQQAAAALQQAGYEVQRGAIVGGDYFVPLLVSHPSCSRGIAVQIGRPVEFFSNTGQLRGPAAFVQQQIRQRCDGLVVVGGAEWAGLEGDDEGRRQYMQQRVQEVLGGVVVGESSSSSSNSSIIISSSAPTSTPSPASPSPALPPHSEPPPPDLLFKPAAAPPPQNLQRPLRNV